jgi:hypothetical protein
MNEHDDADAPAWANGVSLKKIRDGHSWTVSVAAANSGLDAMRAAVETARQVDEELTAIYGPPRERSRIHVPSRDLADHHAEGGGTG